MAESKVRKQDNLRPIRWQHHDWFRLGDVAKSVGLTRSDFIRRAALAAADAHQNGMTPYSVRGPKATPQNMGANFFRSEGDTKKISGGDLGASVGRGAIAKQRPTPARNEVK